MLTRRVAGASRGMYEPLVQGLRESGASAVVMTGDRGEGQLFPGVYASQQPPDAVSSSGGARPTA